jgi:integrase
MRRGEILGLRWSDLDLDLTVAHVRRTLQTSRAGLVLEEPKTKRSRRAVALPSFLRPISCGNERTRNPDARVSEPHVS